MMKLVVLIGLFCLFGCGRSHNDIIPEGQRLLVPVIQTLAEYHTRYSKYPNRLDELVTMGKVPKIPDMAEVKGAVLFQNVIYQVAEDGSFFTLSFGFEVPDGMMISCFVGSIYVSGENQWHTGKYIRSFASFYVLRVGTEYQRERSAASLELAVRYLIASSWDESSRLYFENVVETLGAGEDCKLPSAVADAKDLRALRYRSNADAGCSYVFVLQKKFDTVLKISFEAVLAIYVCEDDDTCKLIGHHGQQ